LQRLGLFDLIPKEGLVPQVVKFLEDQITYPGVKNWPEIISYLDSVLDEETELVSRNTVIKWHKLLQNLFTQPPTEGTVAKFAEGLGTKDDVIKPAIEMVGEIKKNKEAMRLIEITQEKLFE